MSPPLDELYLRWLYGQVSPVTQRNPARTYWSFLKQLFEKEFVWFVPNDDNRVVDGVQLRTEFLADMKVDEIDGDWLSLGCSMLEMLVALSRRLEFETDIRARDWFWQIISNLDLGDLSDRNYSTNSDLITDVDAALDAVIWRQYQPNGQGGLFPLNDVHADQRKVEIWYQMSAYLLENTSYM